MTGETLQRVTALDEPAEYECSVCGGRSRTRMPDHNEDCLVLRSGDDATVYNRGAAIERVYDDVARVRFADNGGLSYVPHDDVEVRDDD